MPLKKLAFTVLCLFCSLAFSVREARADPYVILPSGQVAFVLNATTQFSFNCLPNGAPCTQTANSVTFGTGANTTTFTFTGATLDALVTNTVSPLTLSSIQTSITGTGFFTPITHQGFPGSLGFLDLTLTQTSPTSIVRLTRPLLWGGVPGGYTLTFGAQVAGGAGGHFIGTPITSNPPGFNYNQIGFTLPETVTLMPGTTTNLVAQVGAIPEPTTMLLLGTGLAGVVGVARRRRRARRGAAE